LFLRARTVCITHGHADFLGFFPSLWQNWIYLGHGTGTKALGYLKEKLTLEEKVMLLLSRHLFYIVRSDFTRYMFAARYHVKPERVFITGHPRIDILHKGRKSDDESRFENVLYAPTYREGGITEIFPFDDFDTSRLRSLQESLDFNLNVRFHPNNYKESKEAVEDLFTSSSRIRYMDPKLFPDVQDVLLETDILITDFSSISRDFLFLDRSMIFIMNGLKDLGNLVLPIREEFAFCGYKVRTYEEFEEAVKEILEGKDKYAQVRRFVRDLMYNHIDDKSSERVAELIKELA
jgi:CDP-glycerol glycerophosphotransferase